MTDRDRIDLARILFRGAGDPKIEIEQPVSMCRDENPTQVEKVWANDLTPTINRLEEWADAVRASAWDEGYAAGDSFNSGLGDYIDESANPYRKKEVS